MTRRHSSCSPSVTLTLIVFASLLDGLPALIIFYPILSVTVAKYGIDPLHFGLSQSPRSASAWSCRR